MNDIVKQSFMLSLFSLKSVRGNRKRAQLFTVPVHKGFDSSRTREIKSTKRTRRLAFVLE